MITELTNQLYRDEGRVKVAGKHVVYQDTKGFWTLGIGRLVDRRRGGGITDEEADYLLTNDIRTRVKDLTFRLPWFSKLDGARQGAMVNMSFQLGVDGLLGFNRTMAFMAAGAYDKAAVEMLDSQWAKIDSPNRAKRLSEQVRTGRWM